MAGITQAVFLNIVFVCATGTLSPSIACGSFDWAGPAQLVDALVLINLVAFA